jgi:hypothetical protein
MFLSSGSMIRHPLPSTGSPPEEIPLLRRYYGMLRGPAAHPAALRCLRLAVPRPWRCCSCPALRRSNHPASHGRLAWGFPKVPVAPFRPCTWRRQGFPGSWGTPVWACPALRPRRDRLGQAVWASPVLPSAALTASAPAIGLSGLNRTAHPLAVYASQPGLLPNHARLASGCRPTLPGGIAYPLGSIARFSHSCCTSLPRLCLAH